MASDRIKENPLARFEIEQYELHVATYEIEARSAAEAIQKMFNGDGDALSGLEFIGTCNEVGIAATDASDLAAELRERGVEVTGAIIPSIRAVRQINGDNTKALDGSDGGG